MTRLEMIEAEASVWVDSEPLQGEALSDIKWLISELKAAHSIIEKAMEMATFYATTSYRGGEARDALKEPTDE
jgi:hypothetical protein